MDRRPVEKRLTPREMALLKMRPGDEREWKKGDPTASALRTDKRQTGHRTRPQGDMGRVH